MADSLADDGVEGLQFEEGVLLIVPVRRITPTVNRNSYYTIAVSDLQYTLPILINVHNDMTT